MMHCTRYGGKHANPSAEFVTSPIIMLLTVTEYTFLSGNQKLERCYGNLQSLCSKKLHVNTAGAACISGK